MRADSIRNVRKTLGLSMAEFGKRIGVSVDVIKNMEYGKASHNKILFDHMCDVYHINPVYLETGEGDMFVENSSLETILAASSITNSQKDLIREVLSLPVELQQAFLKIMRGVAVEPNDAPQPVKLRPVPLIGIARQDGTVEAKEAARLEQKEMPTEETEIST